MMENPLNQFMLYLHLAKPLVFNLVNPNDRTLAAAWLQKLKDPNSGDEKLRIDYLKLLLFVLQKGKLMEPFTKNPGESEKLEDFPEEYNIQDIAKDMIEKEEEEHRRKIASGGARGDYPPYIIEYSPDLLEYAAAQDIPNFGVQAYYAISKEPVSTWKHVYKATFPKTVSTGQIDLVSSPSGGPGVAKIKRRFRSTSQSKSKSNVSKSGKAETFPPFPTYVTPSIERIPPTWGSNLIYVSDPPDPSLLRPPEIDTTYFDEFFANYKEPPSGELSGDLEFRGPSPRPYPSPVDINSYQPEPRQFQAIKKLDFDEDFSKMQHKPVQTLQIPTESIETLSRVSTLLETDDYPSSLTSVPTPRKVTKTTSMTRRVTKPGTKTKPSRKRQVNKRVGTTEQVEETQQTEAPSLPYRTPSPREIRFRTPSSGAPSLPYRTPSPRRTRFRTPSSGAPSLPYRTPPSPEFLVSPYQVNIEETYMPSSVETSLTEQRVSEYRPDQTPLRQIQFMDEAAAYTDLGYQQTQAQPLTAEQARMMQKLKEQFQRETAATARTPRRAAATRREPIKTPVFPPMTPSKGAVKKIIKQKTERTKDGTKTVVETTTIQQPEAPQQRIPTGGSQIPLPGRGIPGSRIPTTGSAKVVPLSVVSTKTDLRTKIPLPGSVTKKTTSTKTKVVKPPPSDWSPASLPYKTPPLPDYADLSAPSLPYRTPTLPHDETTATDDDLEEFRVIEENIANALSESQREFEQMEAELKRQEQMQQGGTEIVAAQARSALEAYTDQLETLYSREDKATSPVKYDTGQRKTTKKTTTQTKGGLLTVTTSSEIEETSGKVQRVPPRTGIPLKGSGTRQIPKRTSRIPSTTGTKRQKDKYEDVKKLSAYEMMEKLNQHMERLEQYSKQFDLKDRRQDVERTPPIFSRHPEIQEAGADIVYPPEYFGLTEQERFQPATEFFKDRQEFSPYVDHRRPIAEVLPGLTTYPGSSDEFLQTEEQPSEGSIEIVLTPKKPSPNQQLQEIIRDIEVSPAWAGLPVTTPKRSPSPARPMLASVSPVAYRSPEVKQFTPERQRLLKQEREALMPPSDQLGLPLVRKIERIEPIEMEQREQPKIRSPSPKIETEQKEGTEEVPGDKQVVVTEEKTTVTATIDGEGAPAAEPQISPAIEYDKGQEGLQQTQPSFYQSPPSSPTALPHTKVPQEVLSVIEDLKNIQGKQDTTSPQMPSPQFPEVGDAKESLEQTQIDMYKTPPSPKQNLEVKTEEIEVVTESMNVMSEEEDIDEAIRKHEIPYDFRDPDRPSLTPYVKTGKTRAKLIPTTGKLTITPDASPITEDSESEESDIFETPFGQIEVIEEVESIIYEVSPASTQYSPADASPYFDTSEGNAALQGELKPIGYYDSPKQLTPPPKSPLPVVDSFIVDVAYADYPEVREQPKVTMYPRVSPITEDLEIEPESPTAPPIRSTPRRAITPPVGQQRQRILRKKRIDFAQPEPGFEGQVPYSPKGVFVEGVPLPESPVFPGQQVADQLQLNYPEDLMGVALPTRFPQATSTTDPFREISFEERLPKPLSPQRPKDEQPLPSQFKDTKLQLPQPAPNLENKKLYISPLLPIVKQDESLDITEGPEELDSLTAQHGYSTPLATEGPGFIIEEEEVISEVIEERSSIIITIPRKSPATPPAPPAEWPTPPPDDTHEQNVRQNVERAQQQYESLWSPSPRTPERVVSVWEEQAKANRVLQREQYDDLMPPGSPPSPFSAQEALQRMIDILNGKEYEQPRGRQPIFLYGYGERDAKEIERRSQRPSLPTIPDDRIEPTDDYEYWPGPYQPIPFTPLRKVLSPRPLHPGHSRTPLYANTPPESAERRNMRSPSPTRRDLMYMPEPQSREPVDNIQVKTPLAILQDRQIAETPVSRYQMEQSPSQLEIESQSSSTVHQVSITESGVEEQDPFKIVMNVVAEQLALLYSPLPTTPKGERGMRIQRAKKRLFRDMPESAGEPPVDVSTSADVAQPQIQHQNVLETVTPQEYYGIPEGYSPPYQLKIPSPQLRPPQTSVNRIEDDLEPPEVYDARDPQVSPARRPEIRAPTPPPQTPPFVSPELEYRTPPSGSVTIYEDAISEHHTPIYYHPDPNEELPSPFISYTPRASPPDIDPRLQKQLHLHDYTVGWERDDRPYQRYMVRVGEKSQYDMRGRLPQPNLNVVEEESPEMVKWRGRSELSPVPQFTSQRQSPYISPQSPTQNEMFGTLVPFPPPPPLPAPAGSILKQGRSPTPPGVPATSPILRTPEGHQRLVQVTPPLVYTEEDEAVTPIEKQLVVINESGPILSDSPVMAVSPEQRAYYESPYGTPSPYATYTPPRVQVEPPLIPQFRSQPRATTQDEWQQYQRERAAAQQRVSPEDRINIDNRLQFPSPPRAPIGGAIPRGPIGKWITPPPSSSTAPQPILQRRPQYVTPPEPYTYPSKYTPPLQQVASPMVPSTYRVPSPQPPSAMPWPTPAPSTEPVELEVAEPFGGRRSPGIYDTSPMRLDLDKSFVEDEMKNFKWMDK